jgi:hypothetical protein
MHFQDKIPFDWKTNEVWKRRKWLRVFATTKVFSFRQWFVCDRMRKSFLSKVSFVSIDSDGKWKIHLYEPTHFFWDKNNNKNHFRKCYKLTTQFNVRIQHSCVSKCFYKWRLLNIAREQLKLKLEIFFNCKIIQKKVGLDCDIAFVARYDLFVCLTTDTESKSSKRRSK